VFAPFNVARFLVHNRAAKYPLYFTALRQKKSAQKP
jgi:hypothetical protein